MQVEQRDVPGIDCAYLAMDTEEGVEVVWNEVQFSERKNFKAQEEKIQQVFENLTQLEHPNIVKFHRYWTDTHNDKPRVGMTELRHSFTKAFNLMEIGKECYMKKLLPCISIGQILRLVIVHSSNRHFV